jgi:hypothetical protein
LPHELTHSGDTGPKQAVVPSTQIMKRRTLKDNMPFITNGLSVA